jgi:hypothetical protein
MSHVTAHQNPDAPSLDGARSLVSMYVCVRMYECMYVCSCSRTTSTRVMCAVAHAVSTRVFCVQLLTHYPHAHVFVHTSTLPWAGQEDSEAAVRDVQAMYREIIGPDHLRHYQPKPWTLNPTVKHVIIANQPSTRNLKP